MESPPKTPTQGIIGQAAPERLGKYPLLSVIGTGSMGIVYKSFDPQISRAIALKTIRRELLDDDVENLPARLRIEARAAGTLSHPGIVGVYEYGEAEGYAYIAMEYVEGHSLRDCFERKVRFNTDQAVSIVVQLLKALQHAHEHGVWHRDVKPANILLMSDGQAKVTDFGIARVECPNLAQPEEIMGTPGFIAPEMYLGGMFDHRIDLFAAGVVFYHLLAGVPPFVGTPEKIMFKVCYETPLPPSVVARQPALRPFDAVVLKALARRPEDRFSSAAEFLETLLLAQSGGPVSADQTMMVARRPQQTSGPARVDETMLVSRRPKQGGSPARGDETMIVSRRSASDDANLTIIRPLPAAGSPDEHDSAEEPDSPVTEPLRPPALRPATVSHAAKQPRPNTPAVAPQPADTESLDPAQPPRTAALSRPQPANPAAPSPAQRANIATLSRPQSANPASPSPAQRPNTAALSRPQPANPASPTPAQPANPSSISHPGWDTQALAQIEKQLARFVGPIARVLVRNAARETTDLVSLLHSVATKIRSTPDREDFLRLTGAGVALASASRRSDSDAGSAAADGGVPPTPDYIERASQLLAIHLGPIAKVLAKRAAQSGSSQEQFVATLAAHLSDDRERARFLNALS